MIDFSAFREPTYSLLVAGLFFAMWAIYYTFYYLSSFGNEVLGLPFTTATTIIILVNGAGVPARVIPPFFADRIGQFNTLIPALTSLAIVAFCWVAVHNPAGLYAFAALYGMCTGGFQCLVPSTVASITTDMSKFGTRLGMAFSTLGFAALTGPPIGGALQSAMNGSYLGAQLWAALAAGMTVVLVCASRVSKVGWKLGVKC